MLRMHGRVCIRMQLRTKQADDIKELAEAKAKLGVMLGQAPGSGEPVQFPQRQQQHVTKPLAQQPPAPQPPQQLQQQQARAQAQQQQQQKQQQQQEALMHAQQQKQQTFLRQQQQRAGGSMPPQVAQQQQQQQQQDRQPLKALSLNSDQLQKPPTPQPPSFSQPTKQPLQQPSLAAEMPPVQQKLMEGSALAPAPRPSLSASSLSGASSFVTAGSLSSFSGSPSAEVTSSLQPARHCAHSVPIIDLT